MADDCQYYVLLYVATERALNYLRTELEPRFAALGKRPPIAIAIYVLSGDTAVSEDDPRDTEFLKLVNGNDYYRSRPMDSHELKGGTTDMKQGYAGCGLPVVLVHNTPNNSIYLLWANETNSVRGLFPRVIRHKDP
jgi:hypothetical protein